MFRPTYRISDYFLGCIEKVAALQNEIRKSHIRLPVMLRLQTEAFNRNVHSSTSIEGNQLSLHQVADLQQTPETVRADAQQKHEVENYIQALRWVIEHAQRPVRERDLLHLHALITQGLVADAKCGQCRKIQNYVVNERKVVVYTPPPAKEVPRRMRELLAWLAGQKELNAVVASAVFHHACVSVHPFTDGNGRLARAASLWLLYQKNYDPFHIMALDEYFAQDRVKYYAKIQQVRDLDGDLTYWLDYVAQGVWETLENVMKRIYQLAVSPKQEVALSAKQEVLIHFVKHHAGCGSKEISEALNINRARVSQLMAPLVKAKIVRVEGKARTTKYTLA